MHGRHDELLMVIAWKTSSLHLSNLRAEYSILDPSVMIVGCPLQVVRSWRHHRNLPEGKGTLVTKARCLGKSANRTSICQVAFGINETPQGSATSPDSDKR